jgi:hypothetical protein
MFDNQTLNDVKTLKAQNYKKGKRKRRRSSSFWSRKMYTNLVEKYPYNTRKDVLCCESYDV